MDGPEKANGRETSVIYSLSRDDLLGNILYGGRSAGELLNFGQGIADRPDQSSIVPGASFQFGLTGQPRSPIDLACHNACSSPASYAARKLADSAR